MTAVSLVNQFFDSYIMCEQDALNNCLHNNVAISYSTLGYHEGKNEVIKLLTNQEDFTYRYNIVSNIINYSIENYEIVICNAFHFLIKEVSSYNVTSATSSVNGEVYPIVYGGKYKFKIQNGKISSIKFDLEAQMGNTYWAKKNWGWLLYDETCKNPKNVLLDEKRLYKNMNEQDQIQMRINEMMLLVDNRQKSLFNDYVTDDAIYSYRDATRQGMGVSEDTRVRVSIQDLINHVNDKEHQSHHSYRLIELNVEGNKAEAILEMFEPTKLGYKHLYSNNVYQPYYNEQWRIKLIKKDKWLIELADRKAVSKFQKVSYKTMII